MCLVVSGFAQQRQISKDTINLRGIVYNAYGIPVPRISISSKQLDLKYNLYNVYAFTDSAGYFELKGAMPQDTLMITHPVNGGILRYMNKGSRYMVIYLPPDKIIDLNSEKPITITAPRKYPKRIPTFKLSSRTGYPIGERTDVWPDFPGGIEKLYSYVQGKLFYPEAAIANNIEGMVEVSFLIEKDGTLTDFKLLKGIGYGCDEVVMNIISKSPKWKPGVVASRPMTIRETISIQFKLTDN
jgi:TonB family protein